MDLVLGPFGDPAFEQLLLVVGELFLRVGGRHPLVRVIEGAIREVDAGSCNGCELELRALNNVLYDLERFGLRFVESPRHADVLLVTGPLTRNLRTALEQAWDATPEPKWVVAVGDCAVDGGVFKGSYAVLGGTGLSVPVDLTIGGCPPPPARILAGLRTLLEANAG